LGKHKRKKIRQAPEGRRVVVCVPAGDLMHTECAISLARMVQHTLLEQPPRLEGLWVQAFSSSILPQGRQQLAETALERDATHVLFLDSDMGFPQDMLCHLLDADDPIIGINATARRPPHRNCAHVEYGVELETAPDSVGRVEVYRMGLGVAWVAAEVFRALEPPWFDFTWLPDLHCFQGEDHYFVEKAKAAGFKVVADQDLTKHVNHIGSFPYNPVAKTLAKAAREEMNP
jgi:hypothetical protein